MLKWLSVGFYVVSPLILMNFFLNIVQNASQNVYENAYYLCINFQ